MFGLNTPSFQYALASEIQRRRSISQPLPFDLTLYQHLIEPNRSLYLNSITNLRSELLERERREAQNTFSAMANHLYWQSLLNGNTSHQEAAPITTSFNAKRKRKKHPDSDVMNQTQSEPIAQRTRSHDGQPVAKRTRRS